MSPPIINFPSLQPAIVWKVQAGAAHPVGQRQSGSTMIHFETPTGSVETVEGFEPKFTAKVVFGADWLEFDPDQKHARINMKAVATTEEGKDISFGYTRIIELNEPVMKIFNQTPDSVGVPFGFSTGAHTFFSGDPTLKELENMTLVGNGRMLVDEETRAITVESRISKVVPATGFD
ncbi:hypothetical protein POJ06DRAFT_241250 [Lipomyces tetrasporus]|uniref:Uncharacterized protein n=1 Tax=Lipomyces tetrasporus TaxID=54092 RepID=A0AAD7VP39_9ASCO|nr:uncharacterized protein POJ06DRAFT_241250 [Lipomyces tetrasporus]KAJ8096593.1 hypothetical protein POJ06DRAFT_241250 [Lipomyces tetrasporus]